MLGRMTILRPDGTSEVKHFEGVTPSLETLQEAVDGYLELLPRVTRYLDTVDGSTKAYPCVIYINEEAVLRHMPLNKAASELTSYVIAGPVVILYGDEEFMAAL